MRDDLLDAQAAVDWAERQIAILENRFEIDYKKKHPYQVKMETDPGSPGEVLLVVQLLGKPDLTINAEFGAIINSLRSSLDILNASLARRNDVDPEGKTNIQFPTRHDTVERACWLSAEVRATLKTISSYDEVEALHKLDRKRKHHRLIEARPTPGSITLPGYFAERVDVWNHLRDRSIIFRFPSGTPGAKFEPTDANCHVNLQMALHEPSLKLKHAPAVPVMQAFVKKASEIIALFDAP